MPPFSRNRLIQVINRIANGDLQNLDIKRLEGAANIYRCRIGDVRIIFEKTEHENVVRDIGFRGNVYN